MQLSGKDFRGARVLRAAVERGDYAAAQELATRLAPEAAAVLQRFRVRMEAYEAARRLSDWQRAFFALADARDAAVAAGLPELESVASRRLYDVVQRRSEERRRS